jgi:hypothetical protein
VIQQPAAPIRFGALSTPAWQLQIVASWQCCASARLGLTPDRVQLPSTQARLQAPEERPQRSAADAAWRYRFRQKWRRERPRAMLGALYLTSAMNSQLTSGVYASDVGSRSRSA